MLIFSEQIVNVTAYFYRHTFKTKVCQISKHLDENTFIHYLVQ